MPAAISRSSWGRIRSRNKGGCVGWLRSSTCRRRWLLAHAGGFKVAISDPNSRVSQIQGPASLAIMHVASTGAVDDSM